MGHIKEKVIEMIKSLPEDSTIEDIHYHLYVREKIERGLKAIEEGRTVSHEEAEKKVGEWLKSSGQSLR